MQTFHRPEHDEEEDTEENIIEDDSELTMEKLNDELAVRANNYYSITHSISAIF